MLFQQFLGIVLISDTPSKLKRKCLQRLQSSRSCSRVAIVSISFLFEDGLTPSLPHSSLITLFLFRGCCFSLFETEEQYADTRTYRFSQRHIRKCFCYANYVKLIRHRLLASYILMTPAISPRVWNYSKISSTRANIIVVKCLQSWSTMKIGYS